MGSFDVTNHRRQLGLAGILNGSFGHSVFCCKNINIIRWLCRQFGVGRILVIHEIVNGRTHLNGKGDKVHIVGRAVSFSQHTVAGYFSIIPVKHQFGSNGIHLVHHRIFVQDFGISGYEINAGIPCHLFGQSGGSQTPIIHRSDIALLSPGRQTGGRIQPLFHWSTGARLFPSIYGYPPPVAVKTCFLIVSIFSTRSITKLAPKSVTSALGI